jgi:hypothetical protein
MASEQPKPVDTGGPSLWQEIIRDMQEREQFGLQKYGLPVLAFNGRRVLRDIKEEILDALVYMKQLEVEAKELRLKLQVLLEHLDIVLDANIEAAHKLHIKAARFAVQAILDKFNLLKTGD